MSEQEKVKEELAKKSKKKGRRRKRTNKKKGQGKRRLREKEPNKKEKRIQIWESKQKGLMHSRKGENDEQR